MTPNLALNQFIVGLCCFGTYALTFHSLPAQSQTLDEKIIKMEQRLEREFEDHFGEDFAEVTQTPTDIAQTLATVGAETGTKPAVMWVTPRKDQLHLVLITPNGDPIVKDLDVSLAQLNRVIKQYLQEMTDPTQPSKLAASRQLHRWLIEPFEADYLVAEDIETILFCLSKGVRGVPLAALHDGNKFLVEKYQLSRIPAFNLISHDYEPLQSRQILAMGASDFPNLQALHAVPTELATILWALNRGRSQENQWQGQTHLNQEFTIPRLQNTLNSDAYDVVHLATHAEFRPGQPEASYIQFWDGKLGLDRTDEVRWNSPPLELLVLSACRTAVGDDSAELGFAGLALKAGVKSALASLWYVSDFGTLALMGEFYQHLGVVPTKAAALRNAQLSMLKGEVTIENNQLVLANGRVNLPPELRNTEITDLSHPYYWAGFTMISSPW